jgi:hypothetical protein
MHFPEDIFGLVGGTVIDHHMLQSGMLLCENGAGGLYDAPGAIMGRGDN